MADHGRPDPDEPADERTPEPGHDGPGHGGPDRGGSPTHDDRDPVALAAWRRVAAQRGRRAVRDADPEGSEDTDPERSEPPTVEVPAPGTGSPASALPSAPASDRWTASRPPPGFGPELPATRPARPDGPYGAPAEHGGRPSVGSLHEVLLGLAGRIDDDALSSVRELVAVEDDAGAAELLSGCLLADAVAVSTAERAVLGPWFSVTRVDAELLELLPLDDAARDRPRHRFVADTRGDDDPEPAGGSVDTVARAAARLPGVVSVAQCWRITPAGSSSGPLPHRVLLVATDTGVDGEHVAHHVAYAARDLGSVSVEVLGAGADLPAYHRAALGASTPVLGTAALPAAPAGPVDTGPVDTTTSAAVGAGDAVSEADMLLAELPYSREEPSAPEPAAPDATAPEPTAPEPTAPDAEPTDRRSADTPAAPLDPEEAAARIAALWSTPPPVDVPVDAADPVDTDPVETTDAPDAWAEEHGATDTAVPTAMPAPSAEDPPPGVDGVVSRIRSSRSLLGDGMGETPPPKVNGHHHGVNGAQHGEINGAGSPDGRVTDPPTDPVGWPFVAADVPAGRGDDPDGWHDDPSPTGPTAPTPLPPPVPASDTARSGVEDSMPELSDRERELLARLHAELAARERHGPDPSDPFGAPDASVATDAGGPSGPDAAPPTTPLPITRDAASGADGTVDRQGPPPRIADEREDGAGRS